MMLIVVSRGHVNYLLPWCDVGIDVFEDGLEHGIVAHPQVLDLYLTVLGPVLGHLRGVCRETNTGNSVGSWKMLTARERRNRKQTPGCFHVVYIRSLAGINKSLKAIGIIVTPPIHAAFYSRGTSHTRGLLWDNTTENNGVHHVNIQTLCIRNLTSINTMLDLQ